MLLYLTVQSECEKHEKEQEAPERTDGQARHHFRVNNESQTCTCKQQHWKNFFDVTGKSMEL